MNNTLTTAQAIGRRKLLMIVGLFIIPLISAALWYEFLPTNYQPSSTTNYGQLIQPPYPLHSFAQSTMDNQPYTRKDLEQTWTLVYLLDRTCDEGCSKALYNARQIRTALGKDRERVKRVVVLNPQALASTDKRLWESHPDLTLLLADNAGLDGQIKAQTTPQHYPADSFYLIDPLGNLMMQFGPELEPKLMLKDLQKLLRLSHVG